MQRGKRIRGIRDKRGQGWGMRRSKVKGEEKKREEGRKQMQKKKERLAARRMTCIIQGVI